MDDAANTIPALTVCEPWATAIVRGWKPYENRSWRTDYRGPLVIHAGKSREWLGRGLPWLARHFRLIQPEELTFGAVLGVVDLVGMLTPAEVRPPSPYAEGPVCWHVANPRALERPHPLRGGQGLWRCPRAIVAALLEDGPWTV